MTLRCFAIICSLSFFILNSCTSPEKSRQEEKPEELLVHRDLEDIKKEGVLNILTTYSSTSYFLYRGQAMGYEYELLKRFAKHLEVDFNLIIANNIDSMQHALNSGKVDIIAHGMAVTKKRKEQFQFSDYLYLTKQVLVQKKPDNYRKLKWSALQKSIIHDAIELIGDTVSVRANSSYITRLESLSEELGGQIYIDTLPGNLSTDRIIKMVADGEIKYTVADDNLASINASYHPVLDITVPISFSQRIAWALRKNSPELEKALNNWIGEMKNETAFYYIYNKYFKNEKTFKQRENSDFYSLNSNGISQYDDLIKQYADTINCDWRLLASMIYQESRFNPNSESWAGAKGLLQMMPKTAQSFGVTDRTNPEESLRGGTELLQLLWKRFEEIPDSIQRIKFTLAAYNCGYAHVDDARTLAEEEGVDCYHWDGAVEQSILKLSYPENYNKHFIKYGYVRGTEPVNYVKQIFSRYEQYKQLIE